MLIWGRSKSARKQASTLQDYREIAEDSDKEIDLSAEAREIIYRLSNSRWLRSEARSRPFPVSSGSDIGKERVARKLFWFIYSA